jgi:hypothetical protein
MSSNICRKVAAALIVSALVSLAAPPAAQAWGVRGRRSFDGPVREQRERGFLSYLLLLFDFAGGAMDPNGNS